jgi:hypothetical protein
MGSWVTRARGYLNQNSDSIHKSSWPSTSFTMRLYPSSSLHSAYTLLSTGNSRVQYDLITMAEEQATSEFKLYHYDPSVAAAVVFVVLFLATSVYHVWQMVKQRTWFFLAFIIGGICE